MTIYSTKKAEIAFLFVEKITILVKYQNFAKVFPKESIKVLFKYIEANEYIIKLDKPTVILQLIYILGPIKLKIFKTYIDIKLVNFKFANKKINGFIKLLKLLLDTFIFFVLKFNSNFYLYINY